MLELPSRKPGNDCVVSFLKRVGDVVRQGKTSRLIGICVAGDRLDSPEITVGEDGKAVETVELLQREADKGEWGFAGIILLGMPVESVTALYAGAVGMEVGVNLGVEQLKRNAAHYGSPAAVTLGADLLKSEFIHQIKQRHAAPLNRWAPANRVMINCLSLPMSYDILATLLQCEMNRVAEKVNEPLHVGFYFGEKPDGVQLSLEQVNAFQNLVRPFVRLFPGAVEDQTCTYEGSAGRNYESMGTSTSYAPIVAAYKRGIPVPKLVAPPEYAAAVQKGLGEDRPVVITLREAEHHPRRNSNLPEWLKFADWLIERGEKVVFVRDTHKAGEPLPGYTTCPEASKHVLARVALYGVAKACLFVSNGPAMLASFMDVPWLLVNELDGKKDFAPQSEEGWKKTMGIEPGGQWPWAKPNQRFVWGRDDFEVIRDAWLEHMQ